MAKVMANPLTILVPYQARMTQVIKEETLESRIDAQARGKASSMEVRKDFPRRNSSLVRSKIKTLASTAMPTDKMNPAMPAKVKVTGTNLKMARATEV
ncbi:MAG: hypothetical protein HW383_809 [Candidatus Magasanikbacteria bacterium]|nr:hypothetical protein [Candidatus Magasanikbacteria bacterium]